MAWDKKPFPGTPLRREVMGMKLKWIASGIDGTVRIHSQCELTEVSPPLFKHITFSFSFFSFKYIYTYTYFIYIYKIHIVLNKYIEDHFHEVSGIRLGLFSSSTILLGTEKKSQISRWHKKQVKFKDLNSKTVLTKKLWINNFHLIVTLAGDTCSSLLTYFPSYLLKKH